MPSSDLLRSHDELRAALRLAAQEIQKLNFGKKDSPVLQRLRQVYGDARGHGKKAAG